MQDKTTFEISRQKEIERVSTSSFSFPTEKISDMYKDLKVTGLVTDENACGYYRLIFPLKMLELLGADVTLTNQNDLSGVTRSDYIIFPRQYDPALYDFFRQMGWDNKCCIYECDDDLHNVEPNNPAYRIFHTGTLESKMIFKYIKYSHGLTVTTPELAKAYYPNNQNVAIVPNFIDFSFRNWHTSVEWSNSIASIKPLPIPRQYGDDIVIAYSGGSSHTEDIQLIGSDIKGVLERYPNVKFALYTSDEIFGSFVVQFGLEKFMDRLIKVESTHFLHHPEKLFGFDISLAPITDCQFNKCKSRTKVV